MTEENGSSLEATELENKIIHQIEYYFGDYNLPRDKFLQEEIKKDDGWIPLETMTKFNRVKNLSADVDVILAALKKSQTNTLEISQDGTKIRRSQEKPLPDNRIEYWQQFKQRTIYVKGFPEDITIDALLEFFSKYGKVENCLMRRTKGDNRVFKGSVFVTYPSREICKAIIESDSLKYGDVELTKLFESDYFAKKKSDFQERKLEQKSQKRTDQEKQGKFHEPKELVYKTGMVIRICDIPESVKNHKPIKDLLQAHCEVDYVEFKGGDKEAYIRIKGEESGAAEKLLTALKESTDGKLLLDEHECRAELLTDEEEKKYWKRQQEEKAKFFDRRDNRRGGGRGGGRGGRGGRGGHRGGRGGGGRGRGPKRNRDDDVGGSNKRHAGEDNGGGGEPFAKAPKNGGD
jgi:lupus La protein